MTDAIVDLLTRQVGAELAGFFPAWSGRRLGLAPTEGPLGYRHSVFYRFPVLCDGQSTGRAVLAKIVRRDGEHRLERLVGDGELTCKAQEEYRSLVNLHAFFSQCSDPGCSSVRPLAYFAQANAILVEETRAETLRDLIMPALPTPLPLRFVQSLPRALRGGQGWGLRGLRRRTGQAQALQYLRQSGRWLRLFHEMPVEPRRRRFDAQGCLDVARSYADELKQMGSAPERCDRLLADVVRYVDRHRLADRHVRYGWRHGDYNLRNVLVSPSGAVVGLDTKMRRICPVWEDVAIFLIELRAHKGLVLSRSRLYDVRQLDAWERSFLDGYVDSAPLPTLTPYSNSNFHEAEPIDTPLLSLFRALYALRKWVLDLRLYHQKVKIGSRLARVFVDGYFDDMITRALAS
jgi:hypothetical protein